MSSTTGPVEPLLVDEVQRELRRCLDRVAALGPGRLVRPGPRPVGAEAVDDEGVQAGAPVDLLRPLLQQLADAGADLEGEPRRVVPVLGAHALGHQLAVLARDVLAAAQVRDDAAALATLHNRLVALRRTL
ncbi:hypothetical protein WDZ17_13360 [Pseudokineococcus basanitobsidens]|uniref:Uncharacterized protein n=1 Tax=Pseudokineococcus basanitobsidens TaxID=1926649 RepID=A0ABU8RMK9_9ACTN